MDINQKRKLKEVIRGLIGDGFSGTQSDIVSSLKSRGFRVTQSTVSRTMREMGVQKEVGSTGAIYRLSQTVSRGYRSSLSDLIVSMDHNQSLIVVKTLAGSAMFIAGFIDHECKDEVLGTVAGDDTIFIAPKKVAKIKATLELIQQRIQGT